MIFNKLISETFWFTLSKLIGVFLGLIIIPVITRFILPSELAIYSLVLGFQLVISTIITLQSHTPINVFLFEKNYNKKQLISQSLATLITISTSIFIILLFFSKSFIFNFYSSLKLHLIEFKFGLIIAYLNGYLIFFEYILRAEKKSKHLFFVNLFVGLIDLILKIYFLKQGGGIKHLLAIMSLTSTLSVIILILINKKNFSFFKFNKNILKNSLDYCLPLIPYAFITASLIFIDRFYLEKYFSLEIVGLYFIAYKFSSFLRFLANQMSTSFHPFFFEKANNLGKQKAKVSAENYTYFQLIIISLAILSLNLFSIEIFQIFLSEKYLSAYKFFVILNISVLFRVLYTIKSMGIFLLKKTYLINRINYMRFIFSIFSNLILINFFGINSIPYVFVASEILIYMLLEFYFDKHFKIKVNKKLLTYSLLLMTLGYLPFIDLLKDTIAVSLYFRISLFIILVICTYSLYFEKLKIIKTKI